MEPLFEVQGIQSDDGFRRFNWATMRYQKVLTLFRVMTTLLFIGAVVSLLLGEFFSLVLCLVFGIFFLIFPKYNIEATIKDMDKKPSISYRQPYTIRFFEEEMLEFTPYNDGHIPYTMLHHVLESAEDIYLFTSSTQAFVVCKADITKGTPSALTAFLRDEKHIPYTFI